MLRRRGLAGRVFWIAGGSGTGKTTIARMIAAEVAEPFAVRAAGKRWGGSKKGRRIKVTDEQVETVQRMKAEKTTGGDGAGDGLWDSLEWKERIDKAYLQADYSVGNCGHIVGQSGEY